MALLTDTASSSHDEIRYSVRDDFTNFVRQHAHQIRRPDRAIAPPYPVDHRLGTFQHLVDPLRVSDQGCRPEIFEDFCVRRVRGGAARSLELVLSQETFELERQEGIRGGRVWGGQFVDPGDDFQA